MKVGSANLVSGRRNLLIKETDHGHTVGNNFTPVVHIVERYSYSPLSYGEGGYADTIFNERCSQEEICLRIEQALQYARREQIPVQVNNERIREWMRQGLINIEGVTLVGWRTEE